MKMRFICLANSYKEGGRCMAGIELDAENNPVMIDGKSKWIRLICNTEHGEVPNEIAERFKILNIIELDITGAIPLDYQSENVTFNASTMNVTGNFNRKQLLGCCEKRDCIFGNKGKAVSEEKIGMLNHSLMLITVTQFEITQKIYADKLNHAQTRLHFAYNYITYDFPITDPPFLLLYQHNHSILQNINQLYLSLSIGGLKDDWHYKLVAGVISY